MSSLYGYTEAQSLADEVGRLLSEVVRLRASESVAIDLNTMNMERQVSHLILSDEVIDCSNSSRLEGLPHVTQHRRGRP